MVPRQSSVNVSLQLTTETPYVPLADDNENHLRFGVTRRPRLVKLGDCFIDGVALR